MKNFTLSKTISKLAWSLIYNNPLNSKAIIVLIFGEQLIVIAYSLLMMIQMKKSFLDDEQSEQMNKTASVQTQLNFIYDVNEIIANWQNPITIAAITIFAYLFFLVISLIFICVKMSYKNIKDLSQKNSYLAFMVVNLKVFDTILYIPFTDIIIRAFIINSTKSMNTLLPLEIINIFAMLFLFLLIFYTKKILKLSMPAHDLAPWSSTNSGTIYIEVIAMQFIPITMAIDQKGKYIVAEIFVALAIQIFYLLVLLMFSRQFNRIQTLVRIILQGVCILILEIEIIKYLLEDSSSQETIFILFIFVFQSYMIYLIDKYRIKKLLFRYKNDQLKHEIEYESIMIYLIRICEQLKHKEGYKDEIYFKNELFQQLLSLFESHQAKCENLDCFCFQYQKFLKTIQGGEQNTQNRYLISEQDHEYITKLVKENSTKYQTTRSLQTLLNKNLNINDNHSHVQNNEYINGDNTVETSQSLKVVIDFQEFNTKFFINFITLLFTDISKRFPHSLRLHILFNYYSFFILEKPQLCFNKLCHFNDKELQLFEKITKLTNEYCILSNFEKENDAKSVYNESVNCEHFIQINLLYKNFHSKVEEVSQHGVEFWQEVSKDKIEAQIIYEAGQKFASNVFKIYRLYKEIEDQLIQKDHKLYYLFAQVQQLILNDQNGYSVFMGKMRAVIDLKKLQHNQSHKAFDFTEESGLIILQARQNDFGKILFANQQIRKLLKIYDYKELQQIRINRFMPQLISKMHNKFINHFIQTGETHMLNAKQLLYMVDSRLCLLPVEILSKVYYSQTFDYCFVALVNKVTQMTPFNDNVRHLTNQLIFLTINMQDTQIYEVSENFLQLYKYSGMRIPNDIRQLALNEKKRILSDILIDFNFGKCLQLMQEKSINYYEDFHQVNISCFNDSYLKQKNFQNKMSAKVAIYIESYGSGLLQMGYVVLQVLDKKLGQIKNQDEGDRQVNKIIELNEKEMTNDQCSGSYGSQSSSQGSSSANMSFFEQFNMFQEQRTPRILKIVIQLSLFLFAVSLCIATVNLAINIKEQKQMESEINTVRKSIQRINYTVNNRLILRVLLNMANGYEPISSSLVTNRWDLYKNMQKEKIIDLQDSQTYLDGVDYPYSDDFLAIKNAQNIPISQLQDNNQLILTNQTMSIAQRLLISKLLLINSGERQDFVGKLNVQSLTPNISKNYKPSENEKNVYFIVMNSNGVLREQNWLHMSLYVQDTQMHSLESITSAMITTIISIVTICLVSVIISPIISKTEERKYESLLFFFKINMDFKLKYIQSCQECLQLVDGSEEDKSNQKDVKIDKSYDLDDNRQQISINNQSYLEENSQYMMFNSQTNQQTNLQGMMISVESAFDSMISELRFGQGNKQNTKQNNDIKEDDDEQQNDDFQEKESIQQVTFNNFQTAKTMNDQNNEAIKFDDTNTNKIQVIAFRQKTRSFILIMILMLIFSAYFISSFFMAKQNFEAAAQAINDLNIIFLKEACFENVIVFIREDQIRNQSLMQSNNQTSLSSYYLDYCSQQEEKYTALRKTLPNYFTYAETYMNNIEKENLCQLISEGDDLYLSHDLCNKALNGILSKGISNTLSYMYNHAYKLQMNFDSSKRTLEFLKRALKDETTVDIMDTKIFLLNRAFEFLEQNCMDSVIKYFSKVSDQFMILYTIFLVFLISTLISSIVISYKRLRSSIWNTNLLLKIIPHEALTRDDYIKLKDFYVN